MHSAGPLTFIIYGRVTEEQTSPVAGNRPVPRGRLQNLGGGAQGKEET